MARQNDWTGYMTMTEAAELLRVSIPALRRRIEMKELSLYSDPLDRRVRLIPAGEGEALRSAGLVPAERITRGGRK